MTNQGGPADMFLPDDGSDAPIDTTPQYLAMLRRVSGRAPTHDVEWDAFHARLNERAELSLARLRASSAIARASDARVRAPHRGPSWLEYATRPSRVWRPIAAAAAIAIAAGIHALGSDATPLGAIDTSSVATAEIMDARGAFESAVRSGTSPGTIATYLVPASVDGTRSALSDSSTGR